MLTIAQAAKKTDVNDWKPTQEAPTLLSFTGVGEEKSLCCSIDELSDFLTRKFKETFQ